MPAAFLSAAPVVLAHILTPHSPIYCVNYRASHSSFACIYLFERETESPSVCSLYKCLRTQSRFPVWMAGVQSFEPPSPQEARGRAALGAGPRSSTVGCGHPRRHLHHQANGLSQDISFLLELAQANLFLAPTNFSCVMTQ